jgi:hypothetical protein
VLNAIDIAFDDPLSPLLAETTDSLHTLMSQIRKYCQKHLIVTPEICSLALGMTEDQFEAPALHNVLSYFKDLIGKDKVLTEAEIKQKAREAKATLAYQAKQKQKDEAKNKEIDKDKTQTRMTQAYINTDTPKHFNQRLDRMNTRPQFNPTTNSYEFDIEEPSYVHNTWQRLSNFKEVIYAKLPFHDRPSVAQFARVAKILINTNIEYTEEKTNELKVIPALSFLPPPITPPGLPISKTGKIVVARPLLNENSDRVLLDCLNEVLCHPYAKKQTILYGRPDRKRMYSWMHLEIKPIRKVGDMIIDDDDEEEDKENDWLPPVEYTNKLIRLDPDFYDKEIQDWTHNVAAGVHDSSFDTEMIPVIDYEKVYSSSRCQEVDMDLMDAAVDFHNKKLGVDMEESDEYPSSNTFTRLEQEMDRLSVNDERTLRMYPNWSANIQGKETYSAFMCKMIQANPKEFSLSAKLTREKEEMAKHKREAMKRKRPQEEQEEEPEEEVEEEGGEDNPKRHQNYDDIFDWDHDQEATRS